MIYHIKTSTLSQHELWTIEHAKNMKEKAFQEGIPKVLDEEALLELIKHAWQWDKNAMIQYAKIIDSERAIAPDEKESLEYFLKRYTHELIDRKNYPLNIPPVFQLPYRDFIKVLADNHYPTPASYMAVWLMGSNGDTDGIYNELHEVDYNNLIKYTKYSIEGGYRYYDLLANTILFKTGLGYQDVNRTQVNKLHEISNNIKVENIVEAFKAYEFCAEHGSHYCMIKLAEFYLHGITVQKDLVTAHAWSLLAQKAYQLYCEKIKIDAEFFVDQGQITLNKYNTELIHKIEGALTSEQLLEIEGAKSRLNQRITTWDYALWESKLETLPLIP